MTQLISANVTTNGNSSEAVFPGGDLHFQVRGTFDSATVKLQYHEDATIGWQDVGTEASFTASGNINAELPACKVRVNTASGGGSLDVDVRVSRLIDYARTLPQ